MADKAKEFLIEALGHVLISMVSLSPRLTDWAIIPQIKGDALNIQIEFSGKHKGELSLIMEYTLASRIAARILCLDNTDGIMDDMIEDAARELLNVICGHFMTLMYGYTPILKVSIPKVLRIGNTAINLMRENPDICTLMVEDSPVLATVRIR